MSASLIHLSNLSYTTSSGRTLFKNLNLTFPSTCSGIVGSNGVGKSTLLKIIAGASPPSTGTVTIPGSFVYFRQLAHIDQEATIASFFGIENELALLKRAKTSQLTTDELSEINWMLLTELSYSFSATGLPDWAPDHPLEKMSGGERTRLFFSLIQFRNPDILLLDEPTNNLDQEGRSILFDFLSQWKKTALIVSHDRELLEKMPSIFELTSLGVKLYGGNWSFYQDQKKLELEVLHNRLNALEHKAEIIKNNIQISKERKTRNDSRGKKQSRKGGAPKIVLGAMKNWAENSGKRKAHIAARQREQVQNDFSDVKDKIENLIEIAIPIAPSQLPLTKNILKVENLTGGYEDKQPLFSKINLTIQGPKRIAIIGPNGSGKTTLLKTIIGNLEPFYGSSQIYVPYIVFDQDMSFLSMDLSIYDNYRKLNPTSTEFECRHSLAHYKFRAEHALQITKTLSGGELLRAGLASTLGGTKVPQLIILDEPTNHLDQETIEILETSLKNYDGALLVISHDPVFLNNINCEYYFDISKGGFLKLFLR